jgi:hypothetical protein
MLFADLTVEDRNALAKELTAALAEMGVKKAQTKRINFTTSRPDVVRRFSGIALRWNAEETALVLTRYANGDGWTPTRIVNAGIYLEALQEAGFVAELDGKKVLINGRK